MDQSCWATVSKLAYLPNLIGYVKVEQPIRAFKTSNSELSQYQHSTLVSA